MKTETKHTHEHEHGLSTSHAPLRANASQNRARHLTPEEGQYLDRAILRRRATPEKERTRWQYIDKRDFTDAAAIRQNPLETRNMLFAAKRDIERLTAERDELLAALKQIAYEPFGLPDASFRDVLNDIEQLARQTVAKIEGQINE